MVDEFTRECLALEIERSIRADDLVETLIAWDLIRAVPRQNQSDNGPEFVTKAITRLLVLTGIENLYIEPGVPWKNGYAEGSHPRLRDGLLNAEAFADVRGATILAAARKNESNHRWPHSLLG